RSLCSVLGTSFQQIYRALRSQKAGRDVFLLTISFDPANDTTAALRRYAQRHRADGSIWRVARIDNSKQLSAVLETFGIVIIPDEFGEFQHNAAIHLIDRSGKLARVFDYERPEHAASSASAWL
ncbi:MAG: SCO family protein, partial [Gammaproteobacteria bacterium]